MSTDEHGNGRMRDDRIRDAFSDLRSDIDHGVDPVGRLADFRSPRFRIARIAVPLAAAAITVLVAVGAAGVFRAVPGMGSPVAGGASTSTSLDLSAGGDTTTTTAPVEPAPTTTLHETNTTLPVPSEPALVEESFRVVDVPSWDVLFVREDPDPSSKEVGRLAHDATGVRVVESADGGPTTSGDWYRVFLANGTIGWAHSAYLESETPVSQVEPTPSDGYRVIRHGPGEVLNVRSGPSTEYAIVGSLAHDATDVTVLGGATGGALDSPWWRVVSDEGVAGWASANFLAPPLGWTAPESAVPCSGSYSREPLVPTTTGKSSANQVLAIDAADLAACHRVVITLGSGDGWGTTDRWDGTPAGAVPSGVVVTTEGRRVSVSMEPIGLVRPTAIDASLTGDVKAFTVRRGASTALHVHLFYPDARVVSVAFLGRPARIVVDTIADKAPASDAGLLIAGDKAVLVGPISARAEQPIQVEGFARPFEASGVYELRPAPPGVDPAGPVNPTEFWKNVGGRSPTVAGGTYTTTDWTDAWGWLGIDLPGVAAGEYELFVGEFSAEDGSPVGVYPRVTVIR